MKEISREEWDSRFPDREPVVAMIGKTNEVYSANITHNLNTMAQEAGVYEALWRPEEIGVAFAFELIVPLETGLKTLVGDPEQFEKFNPANGWGDYNGLVNFIRGYLDACKKYPRAKVSVWR